MHALNAECGRGQPGRGLKAWTRRKKKNGKKVGRPLLHVAAAAPGPRSIATAGREAIGQQVASGIELDRYSCSLRCARVRIRCDEQLPGRYLCMQCCNWAEMIAMPWRCHLQGERSGERLSRFCAVRGRLNAYRSHSTVYSHPVRQGDCE